MTIQEKEMLQVLFDCSLSVIDNKPTGIFAEEPFYSFSDDTQTNHTDNFSNLLENLNKKIKNCNQCKLCQTRNNAIFGKGTTQPKVLVVVGENYGSIQSDDPMLQPEEKKMLTNMLKAIDLSLDKNCFITSLVKCATQQKVTFAEKDACRTIFDAEIQILKPDFILALGESAIQNLLNTRQGLYELHGKYFEYKKIPLTATYHPHVMIQNTQLKAPAWEDLKLLKSKIDKQG